LYLARNHKKQPPGPGGPRVKKLYVMNPYTPYYRENRKAGAGPDRQDPGARPAGGKAMEFSAEQMDAMQELANIGAAHAATTLSQMLDTHIGMSVPEINVVNLANVGDFVSDELTTLVAFELQGDIPHGGFLILHFPKDSAVRTASIMQGSDPAITSFSDMDQSAILEIGNIMISSFLSATSDLLGFIMLPSPPALVVEMAHAAITSLIAQLTVEVDDVILFRVSLSSDEHRIAGNILIFLEVTALQTIANRLQDLVRSPQPLSS
jgi:chemotaxis protein CheC